MTQPAPAAAAAAGVALLEKLAALDLERRARCEQRREQAAEAQEPRESTQFFLSGFQEAHQALAGSLEQLKGASGSDPNVQPKLDQLAAVLFDWERRCAEASYYLPTYDQKRCTATLDELRKGLDALRAQLIPKRRFAFSRKVNRAVKDEDRSDQPMQAMQQAQAQQQEPREAQQAQSTGQAAAEAQSLPEPSSRDIAAVRAGRGYMGLRDQVIVHTQAGTAAPGNDAVLIDLQGCTVFLLGHMQALRMYGLRDTCVFTGPITGACFVDDVRGCTLCLASYQVRIHQTHATDFFLRVRSRPIIEHSTGIRFAPYAAAFQPDGPTHELLQQHGLGEESGLWDKVDDFGWIKSTQSPNWAVLPEGEQPQQPATVPSQGGGAGTPAGERQQDALQQQQQEQQLGLDDEI